MRKNDRHATQGDLSEKRPRKVEAGSLDETLQLFNATMRHAGQRRFGATLRPLGPKRTRVSVIVSRPIRLSEGAEPIRHVLIFDDHPATIRLLTELDLARKRTSKLALVEFSALIVLLMLALFWPLSS